ncbi:CLUMA_CG009376, isoform A [Clunio marinus]|uniref:CLUMA_CG009376, isoform A n=1 Tax=Clunio marinus TaxID=568069 RepID=A0A1J1I6W6_9DIPT|nr:CLUMA_CG009376, isoform A [Clunio marinus]
MLKIAIILENKIFTALKRLTASSSFREYFIKGDNVDLPDYGGKMNIPWENHHRIFYLRNHLNNGSVHILEMQHKKKGYDLDKNTSSYVSVRRASKRIQFVT